MMQYQQNSYALRFRQQSAPRMKIKDLPFGVIWDLCRHLDSPNAERFSWRALLSHVPHSPYNAMDVGAFQRAGQRPNGSPTEAVLQDFIARGYTVDDLFLMLNGMGYVEGMKVLQEHASPEHHHLLSQLLDRNKSSPPNDSPSSSGGVQKTGGSFETDPRYGPLPPPAQPPQERYIVEIVHPEGDGKKVSGGGRGEGGFDKEVEGGRKGEQLQNGHGPFPRQQPLPYPPPQSQFHSNGMVPAQLKGNSSSPPLQYPVSTHGYVNFSQSYQQTTPPHPAHYNHSPPISQPPSYRPQHPPQNHMASLGGSSTTSSEFPVFSPAQSTVPSTPNYTYTPITHSSPNYSSESSARLTPLSSSSSTGMSSTASSEILLPNILHFSFSELSAATSGFTAGLVGMGSFGSVYKAMVRGTGPYAVKKLHNECEFEGEMFYEVFHRDTFLQELQMLTKYHHRNILSLVAYSNDGHRPCLVYEYMENGSLGDCLHRRRNVPLAWDVRLSIADQVADALHFLHTVNHPKCLVHGDVKSANILLDSHLVPRLSDFGLARECTTRSTQRSTYSTKSEVIMGTVAYMAPEFFRNRKLSPKMDVYSFGVVLLELYTGLAADDPTVAQRALTDRLCHLFEENVHPSEVEARGDPHAAWPGDVGCGLFDIATVCVRPKAKDRPTMDQVKAQVSYLAKEMNLAQLHITSPQPAPPPYSYP